MIREPPAGPFPTSRSPSARDEVRAPRTPPRDRGPVKFRDAAVSGRRLSFAAYDVPGRDAMRPSRIAARDRCASASRAWRGAPYHDPCVTSPTVRGAGGIVSCNASRAHFGGVFGRVRRAHEARVDAIAITARETVCGMRNAQPSSGAVTKSVVRTMWHRTAPAVRNSASAWKEMDGLPSAATRCRGADAGRTGAETGGPQMPGFFRHSPTGGPSGSGRTWEES